MNDLKTIGLIAGEGRLPLLYAEALKKDGIRPVAVGFVEETDQSLEKNVDAMVWLRLGQVGKLPRFFKKEGASEVVMVGKILKTHIFRRIRPDLTALKLLSSLKDFRDDSIMMALTEYLENQDIKIVDSTRYVPRLITPEKTICGRLSDKRKADLIFGWEMAREIGRLDIGQTVVVRNGAVLAVEAIEGTDEALRRGGRFGKGSAVAVKLAKPQQDMRFDVPVIGLRTVKAMIDAGVAVLGIEACRSLFIDQKESVKLARKAGRTIVGLTPGMIRSWQDSLGR